MNASEEHATAGRLLMEAIGAGAPAGVIAALAAWRRETRDHKLDIQRRIRLLVRVNPDEVGPNIRVRLRRTGGAA